MAALIYSLCALTSLVCAVLLLRGFQQSRMHLLLWSGLCFACLTVSNVLLVLDRIVFPDVNLTPARLIAALAGLLLLVFGLIWESE
ncbi:MAG TPA: DUF5985 family protein [Usitatibacter sp.]|nr:DUF5985 family protein [Usitatibacter sp.]